MITLLGFATVYLMLVYTCVCYRKEIVLMDGMKEGLK